MSVESELDAIDNFPDTLKGIGDYVFTSKYARYRSDLNRRETWDEAVSRIEAMHLKKYDFLTDEQVERVNWAFDHVRKKNVLPSMRSMQFAGPAIEAQELRQFNCATRHVDSLRSFSEIFFLLLCGAGVGIGLSEKYIGRLPNLVTADDKTGAVVTYTVEDTIEGWSDSIEALLMCYFVNTIFSGRKMVFDYSKIRPAGTPLKTSGGQAPGYEGLKNAHAKIKALLDSIIENKGQRRLKTIDAYDILMHTSDAVLSGGVRRCLPASTLVKTTDGAVAISNVKPGMMVDTPLGVKEVKNVFHQGEQRLVKIRHPFGEFECTPNHKMAVFISSDEWAFKRADELTTDDRLVWDSVAWIGVDQRLPELSQSRNLPVGYARNNGRKNQGGRYPNLSCVVEGCERSVSGKTRGGAMCSSHQQRFYKYGDPLKFKGWAKDVELPEFVTEDFAWLVGLIHGDGYTYKEDGWASDLEDVKGKVEIALHADQVRSIEKARRVLSELCPGGNVSVKAVKGENCVKVSLYNARLAKWMRDNVKLPKVPLVVPSWISGSSVGVREAYLAGLFDADGSAVIRRSVSAVISIYSGFVDEVSSLCTSLGFAAKKRTVRPANGEWKELYSLSVVGYEFKEAFIDILRRHSMTVDVDALAKPTVISGGNALINFEAGGKRTSTATMSRATSALPIPVIEVVDGGVKDTFDIEVEDIHQFTANGFVTHNSATIAIFDKSDKDMMEAKTGNWFEENPQRARSNNSVRLIRGETSFDEFLEIIETTKEWGEPGFIFANSEDEIMNPCLSKNAPILTKSGIKTVADILIGEEIWSESGWTKVVSKVSNGVKDVYEVVTPHGHTEATIEHKFVSEGVKVPLREAASLDWLSQDGSERGTDTVFEITKIMAEEVFDITVDNDTHTHWSGGLNVSNCGEIGFIPVNDNGVCGVQVCNLTSINGGHVEAADDFVEFAEAAAIIGTLQAGYTNFPYLSHVARQLTEEEALLGVSITAMMDNPDVLFGEEYQRKASGRVMDVNKEWAGILGINPAARTTCVKPEGTGTIVVGSMSSGVHPAHSRYMFRRVQANKLDNVYRFFQAHNYIHTEESVWSANKTDDVITFPIKLRDEVVVKDDLTAIEHLEMIRSTQNNWVRTGASDFNKKDTSHNVSCTVIVGDDEWEDVVRYVFDNRSEFAAVSFIPKTGDKDYAQAPMEAVVSEEDKELFIKLMKGWNDVDYSGMFEAFDETKLSAEAACAGPMGCDLK